MISTDEPSSAPVLAAPTDVPTLSSVEFIRFSKFDVHNKKKKGLTKPMLKIIVENEENKSVAKAKVKIAYTTDGSTTKKKGCTSKKNGKCIIKLPKFDPAMIPSISIELRSAVSDFGAINLEENAKYNGCPVFSKNCRQIDVMLD
eukprot:CAMPEP_0194366722 /NCGR_PEP_ID=MMETSP0174-20130528/14793_1 /TAXON_ID=216777 /ORGANISM="Proboscia alata, Strain PI-D3" /LENGTH=144 /DNA_ID=CAMNT_0039142087 /DNA_START=26 /DNA_END=460 /DNA_ORIENTATION=-